MVEVFTANEQRSRTSQGYVRSAVGDRLRYRRHEIDDGTLLVIQCDESTGLEVKTTITRVASLSALRLEHEVSNGGDAPIVVTGVTSLNLEFGESEEALDQWNVLWAESEWLAEGRWHEDPLRGLIPRLNLSLHGQDGRGRFSRSSSGTWSTGEFLPSGVLIDAGVGAALAWQIETSAAWHWEISQTRRGGVLTLSGPTDKDHQFGHLLRPTEVFRAVPVSIAFSSDGRDGVLAEMTLLRRVTSVASPANDTLPVVYNDFMNTLMGEPSTEKLLPLIKAAASVGAEYFCVDAGWFADPDLGDWFDTVGQWREAPGRFAGGLRKVIDSIHAHGMRSGIWLEPEAVGASSPLAKTLPSEAFFHRFGAKVREHDRYHLDFRHPAARAHLDETIDRLVSDLGVSYLKLDYNVNPGPGTEVDAASASDGLLGHTRAYREWLLSVQTRYPNLIIENCSSGAMRMDHSLVAATHLQSTSDQQDFRLYPPVAASAPASMPPEKAANWAYPSAFMSLEETAFTLVTGLAGRLYLSGFLDKLSPEQQELVSQAVSAHRTLRYDLAQAVPFWPLGLPEWDDAVVAVGYRLADDVWVAIWSRSSDPHTFTLPTDAALESVVFPELDPDAWGIASMNHGLRISVPGGFSARFLHLRRRK